MNTSSSASPLLELIESQPFFKGLNEQQLRSLSTLATEMHFEPGRYIFREGEPANRFYLIVKGKATLETEAAELGVIPIRTLGPGNDLGWDWLFAPFSFHASARAIEPTRTIYFYGTGLRQQCEDDPYLGYEIMKRIAAVTVQSFIAIEKRLVECDQRGDRSWRGNSDT